MGIPAAPRWTNGHQCATFKLSPESKVIPMVCRKMVGLCLWPALLLAACAGPKAPAPDQAGGTTANAAPIEASTADAEAIATARQAADGLGHELMGLLLATLESQGPTAAIAYCADSAQSRTAALNTDNVHVRRVTMQPRNLTNAPDALEEELLRHFAVQQAAGRLPSDTSIWVGTGADRELRYLRPILVQQGCLACHGDPAGFVPAVRTALARHYPDDRATGYAVGELRGAISVRVAAAMPE